MGSHTRMQRHCPDSSPAADSFFAAHGYTSAPLVVQWMATLRCPLDCPHCLAAGSSSGFADMPLPEVECLISQVARAGIPEFLVTGGEPLIRDDLPEVIDLLRLHNVPWSLNTSAHPNRATRLAIERHPPAFVAVSLDGPQQVHDEFRRRSGSFDECLESMAFFQSLAGCDVTAGTTVTTTNLPYLRETFEVVQDSAADAWGIHLLIPEGRAANRKELFLSRRQMKSLLHFVARKRRYFPVGLADEFGYAGDWEPLLRDSPLNCGAGRAQVVVLPDGSVVPCTTLDRSTAAGNLHGSDLMSIWQDGFAELRGNRVAGKCRGCDFSRACEGGCWLQRKAGTQCYKSTWERPDMLKTAAGVVLCLGLVGAAEAAPPDVNPKRPLHHGMVDDAPTEMGNAIEGVILSKQTENLPFHWSFKKEKTDEQSKNVRFSLAGPLEGAPAARFLEDWYAGEVPAGVKERVKVVSNALSADQQSLGLAAVLWRYLLEPTLDGPPPHNRTALERELLTQGMQLIGSAALRWRKAIVDKQLDPYLARGRTSLRHRFELSKAYRPPPPWVSLTRDTQAERWGKSETGSPEPISAEFIKRHPYAEEMRLSLLLPKAREGKLFRPDGETAAIGGFDMGIFDVLRSPPGKGCAVRVSWSLEPNAGYDITLSPGIDYTYIDLLRQVHDAHEEHLLKAAHRTLAKAPGPLVTNPFFLLLYRDAAKEKPAAGGRPTLNSAAAWYLADFFLF
jgi:AdoMet-dependent heme synthase